MNRYLVVVPALLLLALGGAAFTAEPLAKPAPVPAATPQELASILGSGKWVIVEFGGEYCIPCMKMQPVLQDLRNAIGEKATIRNLWIQQHPEVARQHRIMAMPTQVIFNPKGEEVFRHMGYFPPEAFHAELTRLGLL